MPTTIASAEHANHSTSTLPILMTVEDVALVLRIGRRVLFRSSDLLHWLNQKSAPSQRSEQR